MDICSFLMRIEAFTIDGIPLIKEGDDLAGIIASRAKLMDGDILLISSTVVSKAEGRIISLEELKPSERAMEIAKRNDDDPRFIQAVLNESREVLIEHPFLLCQTKYGFVCVNAGVDRSNVEEGYVVLLPENPDLSARNIQRAIYRKTGRKVGVIITDTNGRAFKEGQTGVAIGIAGIAPFMDWRGKRDLFGRELKVKNEAIVDELAALGNLLMGEANGGTPVAVVRGYKYIARRASIKEVFREEKFDIVKRALRKLREVERESEREGEEEGEREGEREREKGIA
jgi:coenzyme F420-0:L-glutamate ligase/coenzyme F420-1:gamma-L-glutamate ligase